MINFLTLFPFFIFYTIIIAPLTIIFVTIALIIMSVKIIFKFITEHLFYPNTIK